MKRGLSLSETGERAGLDRTIIARAEREDYDPRASTVQTIARALGVPVCGLYGEGCEKRAKRRKRRKGA